MRDLISEALLRPYTVILECREREREREREPERPDTVEVPFTAFMIQPTWIQPQRTRHCNTSPALHLAMRIPVILRWLRALPACASTCHDTCHLLDSFVPASDCEPLSAAACSSTRQSRALLIFSCRYFEPPLAGSFILVSCSWACDRE